MSAAYDEYLVPAVFRPYADDLAARVVRYEPSVVLELAAGTGVGIVLPALAAWDAFAELLDQDVIYEGPQTRERVRGSDSYVRFNSEGFAGHWHLKVVRIVGEGR